MTKGQPFSVRLDERTEKLIEAEARRTRRTLLREWAEADRHHAGCILIWTPGHHEFGAIIKGVDRLLHDRPDADQWRDLAVAL